MALKKFCAKPGCNNLCDQGQRCCDEHQGQEGQQRAESNKQYDQKIRRGRDRVYTEFYHSPEWEWTRAQVIRDYKGIDLFAYYIEHRIALADTAHHIVELKDDWRLRRNLDNLISVSDASHRVIHKLYREDKPGTQQLLRELMERWHKEMCG